MKTPIHILVIFAAVMPGFVVADTSWIDEMIQNAQNGGGTYIESHSSVSTGGQTAAAGETVTTGNSSASSKVETYINSNNDGGTATVRVETSQNGEKKVEEYSKNLEPGEPADFGVSAKVNSEGSSVDVRGWDAEDKKPIEGAGSEDTTSNDAMMEIETSVDANAETGFSGSVLEKVVVAIPSFFKTFFSFFRWW